MAQPTLLHSESITTANSTVRDRGDLPPVRHDTGRAARMFSSGLASAREQLVKNYFCSSFLESSFLESSLLGSVPDGGGGMRGARVASRLASSGVRMALSLHSPGRYSSNR